MAAAKKTPKGLSRASLMKMAGRSGRNAVKGMKTGGRRGGG